MHVAIIGGASTIGSTVAYTLSGLAPTVDVTLVDIAEDAAWAHAKDISHASYHFSNAPGQPEQRKPGSVGDVDSATPGELAEIDPDLLVFNAAAPQPEDATDRGAREAELERNLSIVEDVTGDLEALDPTPLLVVTNPIDRLVYRFYSLLEWPRRYFLGYSLSETARVATALADRFGGDPNEVYCPMMGEHGENVVPVFSRARIDGEPIDVHTEDHEEILEYVLDIPFEIAKHRGVNETSRWVTSAGVTRVVRSIVAGADASADSTSVAGPLCLSTPLDGEYGLEDVALSVPVDLGGGGVSAIHEWELAAGERDRLWEAYKAVQADL